MLTQLQSNLVIQWLLSVSNTPFGPTTQGTDGVDWNVEDLNSIFDGLYAGQLTILTTASQTLDLTALTDLTYQALDFSAVLYIVVLPTGSKVTVGPGASNGLDLFGSTQTNTVPQNGALFWSGDPAGTGTTVDGTHKTLKFLNPGADTLTVDVVIVGAT